VFEISRKTFQWGANTVTMETGEIARQATGAVVVNMDDTVVLRYGCCRQKRGSPGRLFSR